MEIPRFRLIDMELNTVEKCKAYLDSPPPNDLTQDEQDYLAARCHLKISARLLREVALGPEGNDRTRQEAMTMFTVDIEDPFYDVLF